MSIYFFYRLSSQSTEHNWDNGTSKRGSQIYDGCLKLGTRPLSTNGGCYYCLTLVTSCITCTNLTPSA